MSRNGEGEAPAEQVIDRPGDVVTAIMENSFQDEKQMCVAAVYGVCLAMRGIKQPSYMVAVLSKAIQFLGSARPESLHLYRTMSSLKSFVEAHHDLDGYDLRDQVHKEARRIHSHLAM